MKDIHRMSAVLQLGWVVALSVMVPLGLGLWLDYRYSTSPLCVLLGALIGIVIGTVVAVRVTIRTIEATSQPSQASANQKQPEKDDGA